MHTSDPLASVFNHFDISSQFLDAKPYGSGHINDTFLVRTKEANQPDYIFQKINQKVFKNIPELMNNIVRVTQHLREKLSQVPGSNPDRETLTVILTKSQKPFHIDEQGGYWRAYLFVADTCSYDIVENPELAYQGGVTFGRFQKYLSDLGDPPLFETIQDFHNIDSRLDALNQAIQKDAVSRVPNVSKEIEFVMDHFEEMRTLLKLAKAQKIPMRVTHNDTKFNNVLLTQDNKGLCVIDLDTVMPGLVHFDFGDCLRTAANTAAEDEPDLSKVAMSLELFKGFADGFLSEVGGTLNPLEVQNLVLATKFMPFIIGVRFLTDYLDGDNYFKTHHEYHNLDRARVQFQLVQSVEMQEVPMQAAVNSAMTKYFPESDYVNAL